MTAPDSGPIDRDEQLGRLAEELQLAIAAGEDIEASRLAARYSVSEDDVLQLLVALRVMQESLDEDLDSNQATLAPPELSSDYEVGKELGRGGMGIVYRAHQKSLNRDVAVKVLRPGDLQFGDAIQRFEREARSLARLRHRHIVSVHEVGKASGFVYFTMDLIVGMSLQQLIAGGDVTNSRAVKLLKQVASAMTYAHSQGVVHRDLKPANILVDFEDDAFVVDFGLARDLGGSPEEVSAATMTGQMIGTPAYMSPEQALGDRERIGEASDIYALGAVLYECLTGKRPFHGLPLAKLMHAVIETEPVAPRKVNPRVPQDLEVICQTAMQKRIEDRYPTVLAFAEDLDRFSVGREILARRRSKTRRLARFVNRNRKALVLAVIPAAALLLLAWMLWLPGVLRDRDRDLGDQLLAKGNDEAALIAYRSAFAQHAPEQISIEARTRYAHCLVNQAGRLQLRGTEGFQAERDLCLKEARDLLADYVGTMQVAIPLDDEQRLDTWHEWNRISAFEGGHDNSTQLPDSEMRARWQRNLSGPGRDAALVHVAYRMADSTNSSNPLSSVDHNTFLDVVRVRQRLPEPIREDLLYCFRSRGSRGLRNHRDPALEAGLIALIRDHSNGLETRIDAASLFHDLDFLPFVFHNVRRTINSTRHFRGGTSSRSGMWHEPLITERELTTLVENWDSLQGLDRNEQYRQRVALVAQALFRDRPTPAVAVGNIPGWDLRYWLEQHTGVHHYNREQWLAWWQEHQQDDPKTWLLQALRWDILPAEVTAERVLHRFRNATGQSSMQQQHLLHRLLTLTAPATVRQPCFNLATRIGDLAVHWERALGLVPSNEHLVRVATLAFLNGSATAKLIWQKQLTLRIDEKQQWHEWSTPKLQQHGLHIGMGRPPWLNDLPGTWTHQGSAVLSWGRDGIEVQLNQASQTRFHAPVRSGGFGNNTKGGVGMVCNVGGRYIYPDDGQVYIETLALAYVEPIGADPREWQLEDWQAAIRGTLTTIAGSPAPDSDDVLQCLAIANFLPMSGQLKSIQQTAATTHEIHSEVARRARLMAGDASALSVADKSADQSWMITPSIWMRLGLTTDNDRIRKHAFEQLRSGTLLPAFAHSLLNAHRSGTPVPEWLIAKANAAPSKLLGLLTSSWQAIVGLCITLLVMLALTRSMWRYRTSVTGNRAGVLFWLATLLLSQFTVVIDGVQWNPQWLGLGLNTLASWYVCWRLMPGWGWVVPPLWWTVTTVLHLCGQLHYNAFAWTAGVILFAHLGLRHAAHDAGKRLRNQHVRAANSSR